LSRDLGSASDKPQATSLTAGPGDGRIHLERKNHEQTTRTNNKQNFNSTLALAGAARPKLQAASGKLQAPSNKLDKKIIY
jgi:hypothetical protein